MSNQEELVNELKASVDQDLKKRQKSIEDGEALDKIIHQRMDAGEIGISHGNTTIMLCEIAKEIGGKVFGYDYFEPINAYVKHHQGVYSYDKVYNYIKSFIFVTNRFNIIISKTNNLVESHSYFLWDS